MKKSLFYDILILIKKYKGVIFMKVNLQSQFLNNTNNQELQVNQNSNMQISDFNITSNNFSSMLSEVSSTANQNILEDLLDKLSKQEKVIFKNPSIANIGAYKKIVTDILNIASNNFSSSEIELYSNQGYKKYVNATNVINAEMQSLIDEFLDSNRVTMNMVDSFANIKGLLLEIFI